MARTKQKELPPTPEELNKAAIELFKPTPENTSQTALMPTDGLSKEIEQRNNGHKIDLITERYVQASLLILTPDEVNKLNQRVDIHNIEIRPDGLIYYPQVFARKVLNDAFGFGQWALIEHQTKDDAEHGKLYLEGSLYVRGHFVSKAWGESSYFPLTREGKPNPRFSLASAHESAKSDCIVRCGKDLGIGRECWDPDFVRTWVQDYAVKVWRTKENEYQWRKQDSPPFYDEGKTDKKETKPDNKNSNNNNPKKEEKPDEDNSLLDIKERMKAKAIDLDLIGLQSIWITIPKNMQTKLEPYKDVLKEQIRSERLKVPITVLTKEDEVNSLLNSIKSKAELGSFLGINAEVLELLNKKYKSLSSTYKSVSARLN